MYPVLEDLTADPARRGGSLVRTINFHNTIWAQAAGRAGRRRCARGRLPAGVQQHEDPTYPEHLTVSQALRKGCPLASRTVSKNPATMLEWSK
jgi:hypothetical protein